jgi:hypothetical protein
MRGGIRSQTDGELKICSSTTANSFSDEISREIVIERHREHVLKFDTFHFRLALCRSVHVCHLLGADG